MRILKVVSKMVGIGNKYVGKKQVKVDKLLGREIKRIDKVFKIIEKVEAKVLAIQDKGYKKRNEIRRDITFLTKILTEVEKTIMESFDDEEPHCTTLHVEHENCKDCECNCDECKCKKEVEDED